MTYEELTEQIRNAEKAGVEPFWPKEEEGLYRLHFCCWFSFCHRGGQEMHVSWSRENGSDPCKAKIWLRNQKGK
jgi:hypothetical protein